MNGKETVKLRSGSIKFKNYFKQLAALLEIYANFEFLLKGVRGIDRNNNTSYTEKYQKHIFRSFTYKVVCVDDRIRKSVVFYTVINATNRFIETILEEYSYCKSVTKSILISIKLCLQKMSKDVNQVIDAGYVINCLK